jgi:hypothetical protein
LNCRHCNTPLEQTFLDLGFAPPSNAYLTKRNLSESESYFPLRVKICTSCWLAQTEDYRSPDELFTEDYAYLSSSSITWLEHARSFSKTIIDLLSLNDRSLVVEVASNDGYLLKNFVHAGIPCLGIEPTKSTAELAERSGINVLRQFFSESLARRLADDGKQADLIVGNNVLAHTPDINDFCRGLKILLKPNGTVTLEFPHIMRMIEQRQFDTVYHEHFSYLSLHTVIKIFNKVGLSVWNVDQLNTHGGSLRVYICHSEFQRQVEKSVSTLIDLEASFGLLEINKYSSFQRYADRIKNDLLAFLIEQKRNHKEVVAYGAAAKGNTLLNYAGIKPDLLKCVFDTSISKQGKYMPGSHIPIYPPAILSKMRPDYVLILPWNIAPEIKREISNLSQSKPYYIVAIPKLQVL